MQTGALVALDGGKVGQQLRKWVHQGEFQRSETDAKKGNKRFFLNERKGQKVGVQLQPGGGLGRVGDRVAQQTGSLASGSMSLAPRPADAIDGTQTAPA